MPRFWAIIPREVQSADWLLERSQFELSGDLGLGLFSESLKLSNRGLVRLFLRVIFTPKRLDVCRQ
jgi:hypothetical protein